MCIILTQADDLLGIENKYYTQLITVCFRLNWSASWLRSRKKVDLGSKLLKSYTHSLVIKLKEYDLGRNFFLQQILDVTIVTEKTVYMIKT